jgi:formyltetrahydrofolate-dependent phosphoribosylglycinamide formyltransferase
MNRILRVVVLISGGGTTLRNLFTHLAVGALPIKIQLVISSNPKAKGLLYADEAKVPTAVHVRRDYASDDDYSRAIFDACRAADCDYVLMGGFLKFVPIPEDFNLRVINIHPALIPAFCGHKMYGMHVHQAVIDYGAKVSGCTVHFVDNQYDHGPIILQRVVPVLDNDTPATLSERVFEAECEAFPETLRLLAAGKVRCDGRRITIG